MSHQSNLTTSYPNHINKKCLAFWSKPLLFHPHKGHRFRLNKPDLSNIVYFVKLSIFQFDIHCNTGTLPTRPYSTSPWSEIESKEFIWNYRNNIVFLLSLLDCQISITVYDKLWKTLISQNDSFTKKNMLNTPFYNKIYSQLAIPAYDWINENVNIVYNNLTVHSA